MIEISLKENKLIHTIPIDLQKTIIGRKQHQISRNKKKRVHFITLDFKWLYEKNGTFVHLPNIRLKSVQFFLTSVISDNLFYFFTIF